MRYAVEHEWNVHSRTQWISYTRLVGSRDARLRELRVDEQIFGPARLYAEVRMTLPEMARLLPHRRGTIACTDDVVNLWGDYRYTDKAGEVMGRPRIGVCWKGIDNWSISEIRSWLLPLVAQAAHDKMDDEDVRRLLHFTGMLDKDAGPMDVLRFLSHLNEAA